MASMLVEAPSYHAHIYFEPGQDAEVAPLQARAARDLEGLARVWPLRGRPVGPHPKPMFEIEFSREHRDAVIAWVQAHRGDRTVLLHPETGDDLADHRDHPLWLGQRLPLDFSRL